ncbi:MAG: hypothetical protein M3Z24_04990 [Chloroflexota bacterium]|nr:hypothetical protein [Chloroflexota bacterium]
MQDQSAPFTSYFTVQRFHDDLVTKEYTPEEQQARLAILEAFCTFVGRTPDEMVREIFDVETRKYKKRNFYTAKVKEFSSQISGTWQEQAARGNVIRNFFIANGRRLPNEQPDWL